MRSPTIFLGWQRNARDKETHERNLPLWVSGKRYAYRDGVERQRRARQAIRNLSIGAKVVLSWRGEREAQIVEIRRSRVKARFETSLPTGPGAQAKT